MTMNARRRLDALEAMIGAATGGPPLLFVAPDDWTAPDRAAYHTASGPAGDALRARLVATYTGQVPGPRTVVVVIREVPGGPR